MTAISNHLRLVAEQLVQAADALEKQQVELDYAKHLNKRLAGLIEARNLGEKIVLGQASGETLGVKVGDEWLQPGTHEQWEEAHGTN